MSSDDEFEVADAGSDMSVPVSVGSLYKNSHVLIKGNPCKISEYSTAKTGKHGAAKAMYTGIDIFTGRKYEDSKPTSATAQEPIVIRKEYQLIDIRDDDTTEEGAIVALMDPDTGDVSHNLRLSDDDEYTPMRTAYTDATGSSDLYVTVLSAMGKTKILAAFVIK